MINPQIIMFDDPTLATVNIILIVGIVLALLAVPWLKKANRELHTKNLAANRRFYGHNKG